MKVFKYLFISSIMFAVTSCGNDWLDLAPSTQVDTETSINVLSDIEFTLNGIYSTMQSSDAYSGRLAFQMRWRLLLRPIIFATTEPIGRSQSTLSPLL